MTCFFEGSGVFFFLPVRPRCTGFNQHYPQPVCSVWVSVAKRNTRAIIRRTRSDEVLIHFLLGFMGGRISSKTSFFGRCFRMQAAHELGVRRRRLRGHQDNRMDATRESQEREKPVLTFPSSAAALLFLLMSVMSWQKLKNSPGMSTPLLRAKLARSENCLKTF